MSTIGVASLDEVRAAVESVTGVAIDVRNWRSAKCRAAFALLARREAIATWPAIAKHLGMSATGVRRLGVNAELLERNDHVSRTGRRGGGENK